ncbi:MAG: TetR/AcrR family transcriptional regulator [Actinomycetota bacterium]
MNARLPAAERRTQIVRVAVHEFATKGYHGTAMNDIAASAGVTKPVLYQHFDSKRALYLALIDEVAAEMLEAIGKATSNAADGRDQTQAGIVSYFEWVAAHRDAFMLLFGSGARRDEEFATAVRNVEKKVAEAIAPLIDAGLDPQHQRRLAYALVGMSEGLSRHLVMSGEHFNPREVGTQLANLAWAGLRGVQPQSRSDSQT